MSIVERSPTTTLIGAGGGGELAPEANNNAATATGGSTYPLAGRNLTRSGHVFELNDTPAGERVRVRHRSGTQVDMLPDGTLAINSRGKTIMTINNDMSITVHGNMNYSVEGDMNFNATGEINFNSESVNVNTSGNVTQNIQGAYRTNVGGNVGLIAENISTTSLGANTTTVLGDNSLIVNGTNRLASEGNTLLASGGNIKVSAEGNYDQSSQSANIAANSMTLIGSTGTIGGEGIVMYGKGATFGEGITAQGATFSDGVTASTFHGALEGNAKTATQAGRAGTAGALGAGGSGGSEVNVATPTTPVTATPTSAVLSEYLNVSDKGIVQVDVDEVNIRNMIRRNVFNGGYSNRNLTESDIREALRDPANVNNTTLINNHIANGTISATSVHPLPTEMGRVSSASVADQMFGSGATDDPSNPFFATSPVSRKRRFIPPIQHYVTNTTNVTPSLELMPSIRLSVFLRYPGQTDNFVGPR